MPHRKQNAHYMEETVSVEGGLPFGTDVPSVQPYNYTSETPVIMESEPSFKTDRPALYKEAYRCRQKRFNLVRAEKSTEPRGILNLARCG